MQPEPREIALRGGHRATIRCIEPADAAAFVELRVRTCAETDFLSQFPEEIDLTAERELAIIERIRSSRVEAMLAATVGGVLVGTAGCGPVGEGLKFSHRARAAIAIRRDLWGLGLGTALMHEVVGAARTMGFSQIELGVYAENARARALYRKLGFVEWGTLPRAFLHRDGSVHDEVQMVLELVS